MRRAADVPIIAGSQLEHDLQQLTRPPHSPDLNDRKSTTPASKVETYPEIALRHLPRIHELVHQFKR
jgi:hypothetical protein